MRAALASWAYTEVWFGLILKRADKHLWNSSTSITDSFLGDRRSQSRCARSHRSAHTPRVCAGGALTILAVKPVFPRGQPWTGTRPAQASSSQKCYSNAPRALGSCRHFCPQTQNFKISVWRCLFMTENTILYLSHDLGYWDSWGQLKSTRRQKPAVPHLHTGFPGPDYIIPRKCSVRICPENGGTVNLNVESPLSVSFLICTLPMSPKSDLVI